MGVIFIMFLSNYPRDGDFIRYPRINSFEDAKSVRFPMLWISYSDASGGDYNRIMYDRRSVWRKYENGEDYRYYRDFMELFKKEDEVYKVRIAIIKKVENVKEVILHELKEVVSKYRILYGDKCLMDDHEVLFKDSPEEEEIEVKETMKNGLTVEERRKISRKKYEDTIREKLREKSKKYYAENKEILKEKRLAKIAAQNNM
jgi:hypothetical protein